MTNLIKTSRKPLSGPSRRSVLALLGAAPAAGALSILMPNDFGAQAATTGQLNIYSWSDYFSPAALDSYAKKTGVTPNITTYDSNETLFAKLNSPAGAGFRHRHSVFALDPATRRQGLARGTRPQPPQPRRPGPGSAEPRV